jgi:predicted nucleic acid-binding protein
MIALLDNTVISNFSFVRRPDLVQVALGHVAATVAEAFAEYVTGVQLGRVPACDWTWLPILELTSDEYARYASLGANLGAGEAACIACAASRSLRLFTDDRDARRVALQLLIPVSGTLGLLLRLIDLGILTLNQADALLTEMIECGYRSPVISLTELQ